MGRLTERLYWQWKARNAPDRGMGGVPPMGTQKPPAKPASRVSPPTPGRVADTRPAEPVSFISK